MVAPYVPWRIERMIVVAGPSGAGKSTLIRALKEHRAPEIARRLDILDASEWRDMRPTELAVSHDAHPRKIFLHYDLVRQVAHGAALAGDRGVDGLTLAERVDILTVWCPPDVLRRQHEAAKLAQQRHHPKLEPTIAQRYREVQAFYADPRRVVGLYRSWFDRLDERAASHAIVDLSGGIRFMCRAEWEEAARMAADMAP